MTQSRLSSFYEVCFNILIGYSINFVTNLVLIPLFLHTSVPLLANFLMGLPYTAIAIIRQYVIRRFFNARLRAAAQKLAGDTK